MVKCYSVHTEKMSPKRKRMTGRQSKDHRRAENVRTVEPVQEEALREVGNVSSSSHSATDGWGGTTPPEILRMIFEQLIQNSSIGNDLAQHKKSLLDCRLAHPRWRSAMDSLLEKKCLDKWTNFELSQKILRSEHLLNLCTLAVIPPPGNNVEVKWVFCPPHIDASDPELNHVPANSLRVSSYPSKPSGYANLNESYRVMGLVKFFSYGGHGLTSLVLFSLTMAPETLQGILGNTPNLIALTLDKVSISFPPRFSQNPWFGRLRRTPSSWTSTVLPPLPQLQHIRFFQSSKGYRNLGEEFINDKNSTMFEWLVKPYQEQILTFDGDNNNKCSNIKFPLLKRLAIWSFRDSADLSLIRLCSTPESFSLGEYWCPYALETLQNSLACFAESLLDFHLDLLRKCDRAVLEFSIVEHFRTLLGIPFRWSTNNVKFNKLKTFSILYPKFVVEVETLKDMLSCMPHLETLNLLRFREDWEEGQEASPEEIASAREHVEQEEYWVVCPRLKKISVRLEVCDESVFFIKRLPTPIIAGN